MILLIKAHHATITFEWDPVSKRWRVTYIVHVGRGVAHHWYWVDSHAEIDPALLRDMTLAACRQLEAALF